MDNNIFQSVEKHGLATEVAKQITQAIQEGRFVAGEALPPAREFAKTFGVSRPILHGALNQLQIQGFVSIRQGKGAFVKDPNTDILNVSLKTWLTENRQLVEDFYQARLAIEPVCAERVAECASPDEIEELRAILEQIDSSSDSVNTSAMVSNDIDFHSTIARISRNVFLIKMLNSLIVPETDVRKIVLRLPNHMQTTNEDHWRVFKAIEKHNPASARKAMVVALSRPLEVVRKYLKDEEQM